MGTNVFEIKPGGGYVICDYIPSDEEVNRETEKKIRERYTLEDELKLNRLANASAAASLPQEFMDYNSFVESCREEGRSIKKANQLRLEGLIDVMVDGMEGPFIIKVKVQNN